MKLKNVVLIGIVASIMSYLNNHMDIEGEDEKKAEEIFNQVKETVSSKLNSFNLDEKLEAFSEEVPEHLEKAKEVAKDVTEKLIDELNEIISSFTNAEVLEETEDEDAKLIDEISSLVDELSESENRVDEVEEHATIQEEIDSYSKENLEEEKEDSFVIEESDNNIEEDLNEVSDNTLDNNHEEESDLSEEEIIIPIVEGFDLGADLNEEVEEALPVEEVADDKLNSQEETNDQESLDLEEAFDGIELEVLKSEEISEDDYLAQIEKAINQTLLSEESQEEVVEEKNELDDQEIDEIFKEILDSEDIEETVEDEDHIVEELKAELEKALEPNEVEEEVVKEPVDVYSQINELYPYLSRSFVRAVYDLKEMIASEYPINATVIILHRLSFKDVDELRQFIEIVMHHDYRVNVDENQMIVDIIKECKNTDGKILTNIFEIANQARLLNGDYEGYRVEVIE